MVERIADVRGRGGRERWNRQSDSSLAIPPGARMVIQDQRSDGVTSTRWRLFIQVIRNFPESGLLARLLRLDMPGVQPRA